MRSLTFELSRPRRRAGLPVRPMMTKGGCAGKLARRRGSALERGVRRRCAAWATEGWKEQPRSAAGGPSAHDATVVRWKSLNLWALGNVSAQRGLGSLYRPGAAAPDHELHDRCGPGARHIGRGGGRSSPSRRRPNQSDVSPARPNQSNLPPASLPSRLFTGTGGTSASELARRATSNEKT